MIKLLKVYSELQSESTLSYSMGKEDIIKMFRNGVKKIGNILREIQTFEFPILRVSQEQPKKTLRRSERITTQIVRFNPKLTGTSHDAEQASPRKRSKITDPSSAAASAAAASAAAASTAASKLPCPKQADIISKSSESLKEFCETNDQNLSVEIINLSHEDPNASIVLTENDTEEAQEALQESCK